MRFFPIKNNSILQIAKFFLLHINRKVEISAQKQMCHFFAGHKNGVNGNKNLDCSKSPDTASLNPNSMRQFGQCLLSSLGSWPVLCPRMHWTASSRRLVWPKPSQLRDMSQSLGLMDVRLSKDRTQTGLHGGSLLQSENGLGVRCTVVPSQVLPLLVSILSQALASSEPGSPIWWGRPH